MTDRDRTIKGPTRDLTAIGTMGQANQLFTVYEKNWKCASCSQDNYASRYVYVLLQLLQLLLLLFKVRYVVFIS
jgi:hypothetical protein